VPATALLVIVRRVEATDASLSARLAAGDDRALAEVVDRLGTAVHAVAAAVLGDAAAAQDVFVDSGAISRRSPVCSPGSPRPTGACRCCAIWTRRGWSATW
jgi:hypothetical protein